MKNEISTEQTVLNRCEVECKLNQLRVRDVYFFSFVSLYVQQQMRKSLTHQLNEIELYSEQQRSCDRERGPNEIVSEKSVIAAITRSRESQRNRMQIMKRNDESISYEQKTET